jgi:MFS family permease
LGTDRATFLSFLGIGTVPPQLGPHIRYDLGGDQTVGLVIGTFSFVALGARLFAGPLADRRGRKIAFLAGLCGISSVWAGTQGLHDLAGKPLPSRPGHFIRKSGHSETGRSKPRQL